jgi:hypothetical protein
LKQADLDGNGDYSGKIQREKIALTDENNQFKIKLLEEKNLNYP